jgi:integrase/recombinase XerD
MVMEERDLGYFLSIYQRFATAENKSTRTIEGTVAAVSDFNRFLESPDDATKIHTEDIRRYILHLQSRQRWAEHPTISKGHGHLSPHAVATYVRTIRAFFSWLTREGFIEDNPFSNIKPPKVPRKIIPTLSTEEAEKLFKAIPQNDAKGYRDFAFLLTLYGTGLRLSELTSLYTENVNFDSAQLKIMGKGSKERVVSLSARVFKSLFKYQKAYRPNVDSKYFFIDNIGRPLSRFVIAHRMKMYLQKSGIDTIKCTPHTLRHSFAVQFLRNGGDVFSLQKIFGHASLDMTRHYAQLADSDVEKKMKAFSPAESINIKV